MQRRDVKPGIGTSLLSYQNHASLKRNLKNMKSIVQDKASDFYTQQYADQPFKFAHNWNNYMDRLNNENNRLFCRLVHISEVSQSVQPTSLADLATYQPLSSKGAS